jgi:cysteine-rich repeat protein
MRSGPLLFGCLCWLLLGSGSLPAAAQALDQQHAAGGTPSFLTSSVGFLQTFTPGVSGKLTQVDVYLHPPDAFHFEMGPQLFVEIHATTAQGAPSTILHVLQLNRNEPYPELDETFGGYLPIHLDSVNLELAKNRRYGIHLTGFTLGAAASGTGYTWSYGGSYDRGDVFAFVDGTVNGGADTSGDLGFRTYMIEQPYCGDGDQTLDEECDDGNEASGDGCSASCHQEYCGDGVTNDVAETCDDGNTVSGDGCTATCQLEFCGDGVTNDVDEECDDGNTVSDDGCSSTCRGEFCGDGIQQTSEGCDDGNTESGDGCSATCAAEFCGDGVTNDVDETCDDGNTVSDDGCSSTCRTESCGDGIQQPSEECDDGNTVSNDGCSATCHDELCGDGVQQTNEECDDGNTVSGDGCSATCHDEFCGDGEVTGSEWCDDGNTAEGDGCAADCTLEAETLACRTAMAKALQKYLTARLAAVQQCELQLAAGKTLSVSDRADCPTETTAAKKIAKAGTQARKAIAAGAKPKCTDERVATLGACADSVNGLVSADGSAGCLRAAGDGALEEALGTVFPR